MYDLFSLPDIQFPKNFVWGSATAGHQIEGDNIHAQFDHMPFEGGRVPAGKACNHYELYREDVALVKELGNRAFRLSVEWSRIEPVEGQYDPAAVAHYLDELRLLKEAGLQVYVTLVHFTVPLWFEQKGGFRSLENLPLFERYLRFIVPQLTPFVDSFHTLNEPNLGFGPESAETLRYRANLLQFHARAYRVVKEFTSVPVTYTHAFIHFFPYRRNDPQDLLFTQLKDYGFNEMFLHAIRTGEIVSPFFDAVYVPELKDSADYWAVQYYTRAMVDSRQPLEDGKRFDHKYLPMIPMKFYLDEIYPEGLIANLERLKDRPVMITENGLCADDDRFRVMYLALHLSALNEAMRRGVNVTGYLYWSFMDNYEWGSFLPRFGLVHVDFKTFQRTPKPSAYFFRDIMEANGFSQAILRKYLTEMPSLAK
ncbi:MAG: glycoside hydrolase family 1 protein [Anaerolineae bacterium]|nr:glycoside hydrolase family 1 protein [Anaerolineae bacterium]